MSIIKFVFIRKKLSISAPILSIYIGKNKIYCLWFALCNPSEFSRENFGELTLLF